MVPRPSVGENLTRVANVGIDDHGLSVVKTLPGFESVVCLGGFYEKNVGKFLGTVMKVFGLLAGTENRHGRFVCALLLV